MAKPWHVLEKNWLRPISALQVPTHFNAAEESTENLYRIVRHLDLTSLKATDTSETIDILLKKAVLPTVVSSIYVGGVCVFQPFIAQAKDFLSGTNINTATVAGGFPHGQLPINLKIAEISNAIKLGAQEVDVVINRSFPLTGNYQSLYDELKACRIAAQNAKLKVILATGELETPDRIYAASMVAMLAGADFIKTSTGFETVNATLEAGYVMTQAIVSFYEKTGVKVGLKPAGGINTTSEALKWIQLVEDQLGADWLNPSLFRIGASRLLADVKSKLEHG